MNRIITHKALNLLYLISILSLFWSCKTNQIAKAEAKANDLKILDSLYAKKDYHIKINVAYPFASVATTKVANELLRNTGNSANRIDVSGDGNFIKIQNDTVSGYLPFFGESRTSSGSYGGTDLAIQFEEPLKDLKKQINTEKPKLKLEFTTEQKRNNNEKYDVSIDIYPNKNVRVNIRPVHKTVMQYDGRLDEFSKD
ncbi:DUF4251 domain-containing protein [Flavobacterium sp. CS20]|uniref:DUF4251 domain-containing protein n=1 Tax=Flavobacterium sp. CS20 TaxID=2775246 RepID=UPI001B3A6E7E|nr:DUF4251 domain-containing protein [Flavobacterium sp. CS20]QTY26531.1 DUF4251 domain-containing protein [Flavobacterium sp. CS20]